MSARDGGQFVHETVEVTAVHGNLTQEVIKITVDKLKLILRDHIQNMERKRDWIAPLGILATMLVVFPTTEFKQFAGLKAEVWQAIFIIAVIANIAWLVRTLWIAYKSPSVEGVIETIKRGG
ncbi:hypothetical protein [Azonexus sp.]|uniref:hypothetical protein n=1 Tax=Azonexus sp. TaxID=1872668 RepID=UPI0035B02447